MMIWKEKVPQEADHQEICMMQYVLSADNHVRFLSNRLKEGRFIAGTVIDLEGDSEEILIFYSHRLYFLFF
jgi:hypothetical protein